MQPIVSRRAAPTRRAGQDRSTITDRPRGAPRVPLLALLVVLIVAAPALIAGCGGPPRSREQAGPPRLPGPPGTGRLIAEGALSYVGTPYKRGGADRRGVDCSGLVQVVYEFLGFDLPRDSKDQAGMGTRVDSLEQLRPFDLVFFGDQGGIDHVAIHLGDLSIFHASGHVKVESLSEASGLFRRDLLMRFRFARRVADA